MSTAAAVEADGLYVIYRERELETVALRGAEIALPEGTWTSLMGPSGSGKSTLVHVLGGLLEPSGGRVVIGGEDITRLPPAERAQRRRRRIGMVLQRDNLHPLLDVGGNIALPLRLDGRPAPHIRTRVHELLDALGLSERARQPVGQLSGGEAQRVAIAVALAARPTVLLADEITGELDARTAAGVLDILARVRDDEGAAILTVTHNPSVTERADLRLRMRDGIVIE
ncbi:ABC transporter ATP-binding protein [Streptomyces sp. WI04-05B]|uniref:ABC transporter ATP-binding protein n=1 Tax=Streptomyces TaxID=1883 RepID=UPI0029A16A42|nr:MULTISPECIES: ABC transporter ATP-binding protein [unclassified Streptomyces]MDX2543350.1 ABC transporter ATP-binding protein [Streptomyces sp. WI04-05B]MDX2586752.1 ABC transporter ATP-binding protein [Streptomyces sp. WI04-05A]